LKEREQKPERGEKGNDPRKEKKANHKKTMNRKLGKHQVSGSGREKKDLGQRKDEATEKLDQKNRQDRREQKTI